MAAVCTRKNTLYDGSKVPRSANLFAARAIIPGLHVKTYQVAHKTITVLHTARLVVTGMKIKLARLLHVSLILSKFDERKYSEYGIKI